MSTPPPGDPPGPTPVSATAAVGVPRWLLATIIAVVLLAVGAIALLVLTRGSGDPTPTGSPTTTDPTTSEATTAPPRSVLPPVDLNTATWILYVQDDSHLDLDALTYVREDFSCTTTEPPVRHTTCTTSAPTVVGPGGIAFAGHDVTTTSSELMTTQGTQILQNIGGCPATTSPVAFPPAGTSLGPPMVCLRTTEGAAFAIYVLHIHDGYHFLAVMRLP